MIERDILRVMGANEYPFTFDQASAIMRDNLTEYDGRELIRLKETGAADWIYINGQERFQRRFYENLVKTRPDIAARERARAGYTAPAHGLYLNRVEYK